MTPEINYWTRKQALLNSTVLDFICPPNCEKNKISQVGTSAMESLINAKKDIYSNKIINSTWHRNNKTT